MHDSLDFYARVRSDLHRARAELSALTARTPRTAAESAAHRDRLRTLQRDITAAVAVIGGDA